MSERAGGRGRRTWGAVAAGAVAVLGVVALVRQGAPAQDAPAPVAAPVRAAVTPPPAAAPPAPAWDVARPPPAAAAVVAPAVADPAAPPPPATVDLPALRARLPDNLFWELGAPTQDAEVLARRAAHAAERATLEGRVTASEASEEEVHAYYEARRRLSEDYLALALTVLETYGDTLSEQEQGLYALSARMHRSRLDGLDRELADALERTRAHAARRAAWRAGQGP